MIWVIEIPIIVIVIIAMLVGSIQLGGILRVIGIIMLIAGGICLPVTIAKEGDSTWKAATTLLLIQGFVVLLLGIWMGELNLFEFLFGTGWF